MNIFVGAGISKNSPSSLPLAKEFRLHLFHELCFSIGEESVSNVYSERTNSIPFESLVQTVTEYSRNFFGVLLNILKSGVPNSNHYLFARMAKQQLVKKIITTNFDTMLEKAFQEEKVDFNVLFSDSQFSNTNLESVKAPIICKVHGSVEDPSSIKVTLNAISQKTLLESRLKVIEYFFKNSDKDLLIIGYSFSDEFDINPFLRGIDSKRKIFVIKHTTDGSFKIEKLKSALQNFDGIQIKCDTNELLGYFWKRLFNGSPKLTQSRVRGDWTDELSAWCKFLSHGRRVYLVAQILFDAGEADVAKSVLEKGNKITQDFDVALANKLLGTIYRMKGDLEKSGELLKTGLSLFFKLADNVRVAETLFQLGALEKTKCEYDNALSYYHRSLETCQKAKILLGMSRILNEIAAIHRRLGNLSKAEEIYEQAIKLEESVGDLSGQAASFHGLGMVKRFRNRNVEAESLFQKSLEIGEKIGEQTHIAASLHELGLVYTGMKKYELAKQFFERSLEITKHLGYRLGISWRLHDLGSVFLLTRNYDKAEELYTQSLDIKKSIGDQQGVAASLCQLGMVQMYRGNFDEAERLYNESLEICKKIGDKYHEKIVEKNLLELCARRKLAKLRIIKLAYYNNLIE